MWMGGVVPLGYDVEDKRLVVNAAEAENVRTLFRLYLEHGTVRAVQEEATRCGIVTRRRRDRNGTASGGRAFSRGNLYQLLANPLYVGLVRHRGQTYSGQHEAIVDRGIWEAVQRQLEDHARPRRSTTNTDSHALLTGLIFDAAGDRLRPTHASKKGRRYRYYVSSRLLRDAHRHGDGWRLPAPMLEATVVTALGRLLSEPGWLLAAPVLDDASPRAIDRITQEARRLARLLKAGDPMSRGESVRKLVRRIELHDDSLRFELHRAALMDEVNNVGDAASTADRDVVSFDVPMTLRRRGVEAKLILRSSPETDATPDPNLIALLGQAHRWLGLLTSGAADSVRDIARRERANAGDVSLVLPLAFLAPDITEAILEGRQPPELTTRTLKRLRPLPTDWDAQRRLLGFGAPASRPFLHHYQGHQPPSHPNSHS